MSHDQFDQDSINTVSAPAETEGPRVIQYESSVLAMLELLHLAKFGKNANGLVFLDLPFWHRGKLRRQCEVNFAVLRESKVQVRFDRLILAGRRMGTGVTVIEVG